MTRPRVAAVIVGNEVLSAKVVDANGPHLAKRLSERGLEFVWSATVTDEVPAISQAVKWARDKAPYVFTSGGIGPTHDDVTVRAVADALGRRVVRIPELEARVREYYGPEAPQEAFRLADAPEGAQLWVHEGARFPVLTCDGVFLLPGVPSLFRLQLEAVLARLSGRPLVLTTVFLNVAEPVLAKALDEVSLQNADVAIGSYPVFDDVDYRVKVTVEHLERARVEAVVAQLLSLWPADAVVRVTRSP